MKRPLPLIVIFYCLGLITARSVPIPFTYIFVFFTALFLVFIVFMKTLASPRIAGSTIGEGSIKTVNTGTVVPLEKCPFRAFPSRTLCVRLLTASLALKKRLCATLLSFLLFWIMGIIFLYPYEYPKHPPSHIIHFVSNKRVNIEGVIDRNPSQTPDITRVFLKVTHVHTKDGSFSANGRLMLSIKETNKRLRYGDRIRFFCYLRRPQNFNNPGSFDYVRYLSYRSVFVTAFLPDGKGIIKIREGEGDKFLLWIEEFRERVRIFIDQNLSFPSRAIIKALILGEKETIPDDIKENFVRLGIAHILAISGLHIGIITFVSFVLFMTLLGLYYRVLLYVDARKLSVIFAVFPVLFYCFIAGFQLPTVRAFIMIMTYMTMMILGRKDDLISALFLAAFIILVLMPTALFEISFQLSFASVLSLILILPVVQPFFNVRSKDGVFDNRNEFLYKAYRVIILSFLTSAAAILGTAPLIAVAFHRFSFMGFFTNLIVVPFVGFIILPIGLLATVLLPLSVMLSQILFKCAGVLTSELLILTNEWSKAGWAEVKVATPEIWEVVSFYLILLSFPFLMKRNKIKYAIIGLIGFLIIETGAAFYPAYNNGLLKVTFFDVGLGDSALVEFPNKKAMLIDGGGFRDERFDVGKEVIEPALEKLGVKKVDYVVLSHPHADHTGGLAYIIKNFGVDELWLNEEASHSPVLKELMQTVKKEGVIIKNCSEVFDSVLIEGVRLNALRARGDEGIQSYSGANNNSLVIKIQFGKISFLFAGDIQKEREIMLTGTSDPLLTTVIKVPHHGREGSSSKAFVSRVLPEVAVISCRAYGNQNVPSKRVLNEYTGIGAKVYRTDINGAVMIETDGESYRVSTQLPR